MPVQTFGAPHITGQTLEEVRTSTQFWLQQLVNRIDQLSGVRGTPTFYGDIDVNAKRILGLGAPQNNSDAQRFDHCLHSMTAAGHFDAQGRNILNVRTAINATEAVNLEQLTTGIATASGLIANEAFVVAVASAALTADRLLTPEAAVLTVTDNGANSTIVVGIATNGVGNAKLRQGAAVSVIGRSANSLGNVADIAAAANGNVLRRAADIVGFGQIDLADAASAVSGTLDEANGGTGNATYAVGDLLYASAATTLSRLADVAVGSLLVSGGVGVAPAWSATPTATEYRVSGTKVVGAQGAAVADASGGATIDAEARTAINTLLARLRTHGLIAT